MYIGAGKTDPPLARLQKGVELTTCGPGSIFNSTAYPNPPRPRVHRSQGLRDKRYSPFDDCTQKTPEPLEVCVSERAAHLQQTQVLFWLDDVSLLLSPSAARKARAFVWGYCLWKNRGLLMTRVAAKICEPGQDRLSVMDGHLASFLISAEEASML